MSRARRPQDEEEGTIRLMLTAQLLKAVERAADAQAVAEMEMKRRDDVIRRCKARGLSLAEIASLVGVSRARIQQLAPTETVDEVDTDEVDEALASASTG